MSAGDFNAAAGTPAAKEPPVRKSLLLAVLANNADAVEELLKQGQRLDAETYRVEVLQERSRLALARPFIAFGGMDIDATDSYGNTALLLTVICREFALATWLVERGADLEKSNRDRTTPLASAASGGRMDFLRYFLDKGAKLYKDYAPTHKVLIRGSTGNNEAEVNALLDAEPARRQKAIDDRLAAEAAAARAAHYTALKAKAPRLKLQ